MLDGKLHAAKEQLHRLENFLKNNKCEFEAMDPDLLFAYYFTLGKIYNGKKRYLIAPLLMMSQARPLPLNIQSKHN